MRHLFRQTQRREEDLIRKMRAYDYKGKTYGELTVIEEAERRPAYGRDSGSQTIKQWRLKCACGREDILKTQVNLNRLRRNWELRQKGEGNPNWTFHCNESPVHFISCAIGDKCGDLEVVGFAENSASSRNSTGYRWLIQCICHNCKRYSVKNPYLLRNNQWDERVRRLKLNPETCMGCGCRRGFKHGYAGRTEDGRHEKYEYSMWNNANRRAAQSRKEGKPIPFNITPQDIEEIGIPDTCPVLGIPIVIPSGDGSGERNDNSPSLDKFIPSLGYVKGNIHVISWRANRFKSDGTPEEWQKIAEWCQREDVRRKLSGEFK